ncbi:MAG: hypothetical protein HY219_00035 [Candidatus Staskawiczbacteria bacterium]|nr:hypothetical protein [Candidatus Staskawiczbacteria bacterium]
MDFLKKSILYFKKPKVIFVMASGERSYAEAIFQVLKPSFKIQKLYEKIPDILNIVNTEIFIVETNFKNEEFLEEIKFFLKNSQLPVLVVAQAEIPPDSLENIKELTLEMPPYGSLILNFDEKIIYEINKITNLKNFSFGFSEKADFVISDVNETENNTNFKLNYKGNIVPIWLKKVLGKKEIYNVLPAICVGILLGLNIVEMSETLKNLGPIDKI